ncbi:4'-phosphopantetheinyl transferase EntD [Roseovarius sp. MBR-78]|uniref:4'-phosphopantetheinyl transferase family protein n=1 Tax=Roseovarius sp. MBR-78 TaxID=3156460 RepID=UPI003390BB61
MSLVAALRAMLPPGLALAGADPRAAPDGLCPEERPATARMTSARLREYAAGRRAARAAMAALGLSDAPIVMGRDRAPVWPEGVIGTISHDATTCLALVGRARDWDGLGLDLEPATPLPEDVAALVCLPFEAADAGAARRVFCAKEAAYKALYPRITTVLDFADMTVTLGPGPRFEARLARAAGPFDAGTTFPGQIVEDARQVAALVLLPRGAAPVAAL